MEVWGEKRRHLRMLSNRKARLSAFSMVLRNQLSKVFGPGVSVWLGGGLRVPRGGHM